MKNKRHTACGRSSPSTRATSIKVRVRRTSSASSQPQYRLHPASYWTSLLCCAQEDQHQETSPPAEVSTYPVTAHKELFVCGVVLQGSDQLLIALLTAYQLSLICDLGLPQQWLCPVCITAFLSCIQGSSL